jgi:hypothetical protein
MSPFSPIPEQGIDLQLLLGRLREVFVEVCPISMEDWQDGFWNEADPQKEIVIWLYIAAAYRKLTLTKQSLSREQRKQVFAILLACSVVRKKHVLSFARHSALGREAAEKIIDTYLATTPEEAIAVSKEIGVQAVDTPITCATMTPTGKPDKEGTK